MKEGKFFELFKNPSQVPFEFHSLINYLESFIEKPKVIIEIGVLTGGSFRFWADYISQDGILIGVDSNERDNMAKVREEFLNDSRIKLVIGDSTSGEVVGAVSDILGNSLADILFIDGNHEYDFVSKDFKNYGKFVKRGGYIVFHDIVNPTVRRLWDFIVASMDFKGYCEFWQKNRPCGIGLIQKE
jgi:cephalosporin hydroxylase